MYDDCRVVLYEDGIRRDADGAVFYHPLNGPYGGVTRKQGRHRGLLTVASNDLASSNLLGDCRVFHLEFFGEGPEIDDREAWADPLRALILQRLCRCGWNWYLSCTGIYLDGDTPDHYQPVVQDIEHAIFEDETIDHAVLECELPPAPVSGFYPRLFFEAPVERLPQIVARYWPEAMPGYQIEGYNLPPGTMNTLRAWNRRPRDDRLFRDVLDQTHIFFYTFPAENRHFCLLTNKLDLDGVKELLDLADLQSRVTERCRQMKLALDE